MKLTAAHVWLLTSLAGLFAACGDSAEPTRPKAFAAQRHSCADSLAGDAARAGQNGVAWLLYACEGDGCTGAERFTRGLHHAIQLEVEAAPESALLVQSTDHAVASVFDVVSTYDPCANKLRAWATLDAQLVGETTLSIRDAHGELDAIAISVAEPASIRLRASHSAAFAFESATSSLRATEGDSWLLFPELYDAEQVLLVGLPPLTWEVFHPDIAEVHPTREPSLSERAAPGAVQVEAKRAGVTTVQVHSAGGASASLLLQVSPQ